MFDPFAREEIGVEKIMQVKIEKDGEVVNTTVAQMNFIYWMISNNIHTYIELNAKKIKTEVKHSNMSKRQTRVIKQRKKTPILRGGCAVAIQKTSISF